MYKHWLLLTVFVQFLLRFWQWVYSSWYIAILRSEANRTPAPTPTRAWCPSPAWRSTISTPGMSGPCPCVCACVFFLWAKSQLLYLLYLSEIDWMKVILFEDLRQQLSGWPARDVVPAGQASPSHPLQAVQVPGEANLPGTLTGGSEFTYRKTDWPVEVYSIGSRWSDIGSEWGKRWSIKMRRRLLATMESFSSKTFGSVVILLHNTMHEKKFG